MTTFTPRQADFVIITALEKEAQAVVSRLENHTVERFQARDIRTYHCGTVSITGTSRAYKVAVVLLPSMGEISAANATTDALNAWNPNYVLMVGIAGGIAQDDLDLGDVVVADQVVGYEYGKVEDERIKPRDHVYPASALLLERVRNFWDDAWAEQVKAIRPKNASRDKSKRFVGPIASGNKVIASKLFQAQLKERWPKLIAVETEAEGVFAAVFDRPQIRGTLVIRGISDMADKAKDDAWQEYAANAAAAHTIAWLKSGPVDTVVETLHASRTSLPHPIRGNMTKPTVFISYSHKDEAWKDRLVTHLGVLQSQGLLDLWDDRRIGAGQDWHQEIEQAMAAASVAVLLVSAHFLTSQFILGEEAPRLLQRRDKEGLHIFPVIVRPCAWQAVGWLSRMQARPQDGRPLSSGDENQIDADLAAMAQEVYDLLKP